MAEQTKEKELNYQERLNISVLTIEKIKDLLKNDIHDTIASWNKGRDVQKQSYRIIGPAGVGKTQICHQIVDELTDELFGEHNKQNPSDKKIFEIIMVKAPVLSRDEFIIPFPVEDKSKAGAFKFKMLYSNFIPTEPNSFGLFVIDEFSRGDHQLQQLLWQIQNEYSVHRFKFPKGWFVISTDNPDDSEYSMEILEDAAGLRRQLHVYVEVNVIAFLNYAIKNKFHPFVIEFIQTHPDYIYDFKAQQMGSVYANPASYEKLSDILWKMELGRNSINFNEIEVKASGLLNTHMAAMFISFAKDKKDINPKDIFHNLKQVKPRIEELVKKGEMAKLGQLMVGYCAYMTSSMPVYNAGHLQNILDFLLLMPVDTAALFISQIDKFDRLTPAFKYMTKIHMTLLEKSKLYKENFYEPILEAGDL